MIKKWDYFKADYIDLKKGYRIKEGEEVGRIPLISGIDIISQYIENGKVNIKARKGKIIIETI